MFFGSIHILFWIWISRNPYPMSSIMTYTNNENFNQSNNPYHYWLLYWKLVVRRQRFCHIKIQNKWCRQCCRQRCYIQDKKSCILILEYDHPTSLRQDQSVAVGTTDFAYTNGHRTKNTVTKPTLYMPIFGIHFVLWKLVMINWLLVILLHKVY